MVSPVGAGDIEGVADGSPSTAPRPVPALDEVVVVTGGASGIGEALARRFAAGGCRAVVVADIDGERAEAVAASLPGEPGIGVGVRLDVTSFDETAALVERVEAELGPIGVWCSNAGIATAGGLGSDADWDRAWRTNTLPHVYAGRTVVPLMAARGRGQLVVTASAAGLLTEMDNAPYSASKHAAVAVAEWLAIRFGDTGVAISCLCPLGVRTPMLDGAGPASATLASGGLAEPADVAEAVVAAIATGTFLVLPHPAVADFERRRAGDRDRWLAGMRRVRARLDAVRAGTATVDVPAESTAGIAADGRTGS